MVLLSCSEIKGEEDEHSEEGESEYPARRRPRDYAMTESEKHRHENEKISLKMII